MLDLESDGPEVQYLLGITFCHCTFLFSCNIASNANIGVISDLKSCLSSLNWPCSGKKSEFLALFGLAEGTLGIDWK